MAVGIFGAAAVFLYVDRHAQLSDEGYIFANRVRAARDAAIVDGRPIRLWVSPTAGGGYGYGFDEWEKGRWRSMIERAMRPARWEAGTRVMAGGLDRMQATFDGAGRPDHPVLMSVSRGRNSWRLAITTTGAVRIDE